MFCHREYYSQFRPSILLADPVGNAVMAIRLQWLSSLELAGIVVHGEDPLPGLPRQEKEERGVP